MRKSAQFIGFCGLILILFGQISWFSAPTDVYALFPIHTSIGIICLLWFLIQGGSGLLKHAATHRSTSQGLSLSLYTILFVGVLTLVNIVAMKVFTWRFDSTEEKVYTLAPETTAVFGELEYPLAIRGFFLGGKIDDPKTRDLINRITKLSNKISFQLIDPEKKLTLLDKFGISQAGTLHFTLEIPDKPREAKLTRNITEQEIVNTIKKLTRGNPRPVYYLVGHGEPEIGDKPDKAGYTFAREALEGENLSLQKLVIGSAGEIPTDAAALVVAAPRTALLAHEKEMVAKYLQQGGNAFFLFEPRTSRDIPDLVAPLGIRVGEDVVVDQIATPFSSGGLGVQPLVTDFPSHPVTDDFKQSIVVTTATSVRAASSNIDSLSELGVVTEIARTGPNSWAETDLEQLFSQSPQAALTSEDIKGPVSVAAAYEGKRGKPYAGRIVVIGDGEFANNTNLNQVFNRDFFLNALNWIIGEESGIVIRSGTMRASKKEITTEEFSKIFSLTGIIFPELILLIGLGVWWFRRR